MITAAPRIFGPLLIGGGITQANPNMLKDLIETFASSPLAQILRARDDDIIDLDEEREKREAENETSVEEKAEEIKEKAKDIEKEGSAADQFDDVMSDVFGVSRKNKDKSVLDINIGKVKDTLEGLGIKDKSISEKIAKDMVGGYDDAVLGNDEIMSEIMNREDVKEQIKKDREDREPNAMGGMIDKAISYGPRN